MPINTDFGPNNVLMLNIRNLSANHQLTIPVTVRQGDMLIGTDQDPSSSLRKVPRHPDFHQPGK